MGKIKEALVEDVELDIHSVTFKGRVRARKPCCTIPFNGRSQVCVLFDSASFSWRVIFMWRVIFWVWCVTESFFLPTHTVGIHVLHIIYARCFPILLPVFTLPPTRTHARAHAGLREDLGSEEEGRVLLRGRAGGAPEVGPEQVCV